MSDNLARWLYDHAVTLDQDIADGTFRPAPSRRYRVNGHDFWFHTWVKDTEMGPLYYGTAVISDDLK